MPLRLFFLPNDKPVAVDPVPAEHPALESRSFWRTGLLLATSAALGGIAVAIWNRRALAQMRQQVDSSLPFTHAESEVE